MFLEIVGNMFQKKNKSNKFKTKFWSLILYYIRLQYGKITGQIYFKWNQENNLKLMINPNEITSMLDQNIKKFLMALDVKNIIDTENGNGYEHLGYGCFATRVFDKPIIFSQGDSTFFFKTMENTDYFLDIVFQSVLGLKIKIFVEDECIYEKPISNITQKFVQTNIPSRLIKNDVTKIIVSTNKLWNLKFLDKNMDEIPIGVGIKKIGLNQITE